MSNPQKDKGDKAEREAAALLNELLGLTTVKRALGAGRKEDVGDIFGIPDTVVQVADWKEKLTAIREKTRGAVAQQANAGARFGFAMTRQRGGSWIVSMTPEQLAQLWTAARAVTED